MFHSVRSIPFVYQTGLMQTHLEITANSQVKEVLRTGGRRCRMLMQRHSTDFYAICPNPFALVPSIVAPKALEALAAFVVVLALSFPAFLISFHSFLIVSFSCSFPNPINFHGNRRWSPQHGAKRHCVYCTTAFVTWSFCKIDSRSASYVVKLFFLSTIELLILFHVKRTCGDCKRPE